MKNYFGAVVGRSSCNNGSRAMNLLSKKQFKSKIFQRKIVSNIPNLIEPH